MAYYIVKKTNARESIKYLPEEIVLTKTQEKVSLDFYKNTDYDDLYTMLKEVVDAGTTYPTDKLDKVGFENYYLTHEVFVIRNNQDQKAIAAFYIKPNFPGRSSHICNAGFVVSTRERGKGIGEIIFSKYLRLARDLGYEASFFNLVYASNEASIRCCRKLGFKEIGVVPKAGKLKGLGYVDALQFYYDLTTLD